MALSRLHWLTPAALGAAALVAQAQDAGSGSRRDPLDPHASVPAVVYESSFNPYRRLRDEAPTPWREANDTVARIGGWRSYAREAQAPKPDPAVPDLVRPMPKEPGAPKAP